MNSIQENINKLEIFKALTRQELLEMNEFPKHTFDIEYNNIPFTFEVVNYGTEQFSVRIYSENMWSPIEIYIDPQKPSRNGKKADSLKWEASARTGSGSIRWKRGDGAFKSFNNQADFFEQMKAVNQLEAHIIEFLTDFSEDKEVNSVLTSNIVLSREVEAELDKAHREEVAKKVESDKKDFNENHKFIFDGDTAATQKEGALKLIRKLKKEYRNSASSSPIERVFDVIDMDYNKESTHKVWVSVTDELKYKILPEEGEVELNRNRIRTADTQGELATALIGAYE